MICLYYWSGNQTWSQSDANQYAGLYRISHMHWYTTYRKCLFFQEIVFFIPEGNTNIPRPHNDWRLHRVYTVLSRFIYLFIYLFIICWLYRTCNFIDPLLIWNYRLKNKIILDFHYYQLTHSIPLFLDKWSINDTLFTYNNDKVTWLI